MIADPSGPWVRLADVNALLGSPHPTAATLLAEALDARDSAGYTYITGPARDWVAHAVALLTR